ncbi:MAG: hypothetical protein U0527_15565 [Candidatus Eisenbacteria bacterium]
MSAAMKLVVNTAYGYLAAGGGLTRFADVHAANEVTRRGLETLSLICREFQARGDPARGRHRRRLLRRAGRLDRSPRTASRRGGGSPLAAPGPAGVRGALRRSAHPEPKN